MEVIQTVDNSFSLYYCTFIDSNLDLMYYMTPKALNLIELILVLQEDSKFRVQDKDQECGLKSGPFGP